MASTGILLALFVPVLNPATMSSFATYLIGYFIFVIGLAVGAYLLHVPSQWIGVGALIFIGVGILSATQRTKPRDPPS